MCVLMNLGVRKLMHRITRAFELSCELLQTMMIHHMVANTASKPMCFNIVKLILALVFLSWCVIMCPG